MPTDHPGLHPLDRPVAVPSHVDPRLVVDFDYLDPPGLAEHGDIYASWRTLHAGPDIVWTPHHGGHWILTRGEDIKWAQEDYQVFSHAELTVPRGAGINLPPLTLDPPENIPYRATLNPGFTKQRVEEVYLPKVRALTIEMVEALKPRGRCEFVEDFAHVMPVNIFLGIVDLPKERRAEFLAWGRGLSNPETRTQYQAQIAAYLAEVLRERSANPGDDLLSQIAGWRKSRHFKHEDEMIGMAMLVFAGGLDTVAGELSFAMLHLARHPEQQRRLRDEPAIVPQAAEEFLRRHALSHTARVIARESERKGARFMPGDMVIVPVALSGIDDRLYQNPLEIDFDRPPAPHNTFGNGPHKCIGERLARMEIRVFLEEWFKRMPDVRLDPTCGPVSHLGAVEGLSRLGLIWDA